MTDLKAQLRALLPEFADAADDELAMIVAAGEVREFAAGDSFGQAGEVVEGGFFVLEGALEAWVHVPGGADEYGLTARAGMVGDVATLVKTDLVGVGTWRAVEPTRTLFFPSSVLGALERDHPAAGVKLMRVILDRLCDRMELAVDRYRTALAWGRRISGISHLTWGHLVGSGTQVSFDLTNGGEARGELLQVVGDGAEREFTLRTAAGVEIVRYHAVACVRFDNAAADAAREAFEAAASAEVE